MEYVLNHHGIKGMKWGVRRYQNKNGSLTPAGKKRRKSDNYHEDYKKAHDGKSVKQLSTKELRERNDRLQQEQNYQRLTQKKNRGAQAVKTFISVAGTTTAAITAYKTYRNLGENALNTIGDWVVKGIDLSKPLA